MTSDEWKQYKDFDILRSEMNGDFRAFKMNILADTDNGGFLKPKKRNAAQIISDPPRAE